MDYYYTDINGQTKGPVPEDQLRLLVSSGAVTATSMVVPVGSRDWLPLTAVIPVVAAGVGRTEPLSVWSFVLSLFGLFCCGFVLGIPAIICGHLALSSIRRHPYLAGRGLAIAGLIIGYLATFGWLVYLIFLGGLGALQNAAQSANH